MKKYINIILFSFFGLMSINLNMGFSIYIPYVCYILYTNKKNRFKIFTENMEDILWIQMLDLKQW